MHQSRNKVPLIIVGSVLLVAGFFVGKFMARSPAIEEGKSKSATREISVEIPAGTTIPLILLDRLQSGQSDEGNSVRLCVANDVSLDGKIVFAKGAEAEGLVSWSRRGDIGSSLANKPARLAIQVQFARAVDGTKVDLSVEGDQHEFKGDNTQVAPDEVPSAPEILSESEKAALEAFSNKGLDALKSDATRTEIEGLLARTKGLPNEAKKVRLSEVLGAGRIAAGDLSGVLAISNLAETTFDRIGAMLKTKQVVAPVGCRVDAKSKTAVKVQVRGNQ